MFSNNEARNSLVSIMSGFEEPGGAGRRKMTDREMILLALELLILKLEVERREHTYSAIQEARLATARRVRDKIAASPEPA